MASCSAANSSDTSSSSAADSRTSGHSCSKKRGARGFGSGSGGSSVARNKPSCSGRCHMAGASCVSCGVERLCGTQGRAHRRGVDPVHRREIAANLLALDADDPVADFNRRHGLGCGRTGSNRLDAARWGWRRRGVRSGFDRQAEVSLQIDHRYDCGL